MSDSIYKFAAQNQLRFASKRGDLTAEQLFQLPLKSHTGFDLDTVARTINGQLKGVSEESFVEDNTADPRKQALSVALEIVKDVIATKQAENRASLTKANKAMERKKILDAIAAKRDEKLSQASLDELEKQLAAIDG
jgi:hypothetical protein